MDMQETLRKKRGEIIRVAAKHGARNVRVFGSVARGDADSHSDIDLIADLEAGTGLFDHAALVTELNELLGCKVDVISSRGIKARIRARVLEEAVPL